MSDEFDKEAEREKLREKFADDDQKREHTQRLSELLLKGATMTNRHCEECGDPIFSYEGREFCPTCNAASAADAPNAPDSDAGTPDEAGEPGRAARNSGRTGGQAGRAGGETGRGGDETGRAGGRTGRAAAGSERSAGTPAENAGREVPGTPEVGEGGDGATPNGVRAPRAGNQDVGRGRGTDPRSPGASDADSRPVDDGVAVGRESLARSLARFAQAAERAEDPRRAREHLRAAREAAEALAALE